jgi:hypothetical protein
MYRDDRRISLSLSRPLATARRLGEVAPDRHRFVDKRVLLSANAQTLEDATARFTLLMAMRLLPRICPDVTVRLERAPIAFVRMLKAEACRIAFGRPIEFDDSASTDAFDAILHVGPERNSAAPWVSVVTRGWCVQVATTGGSAYAPIIPLKSDTLNSVAAVMGASVATTEVFKLLIGLKPSRGLPASGVPYSLFLYSETDDPGPVFPSLLSLDATLVGFGALGNGIVATLEGVRLAGRLVVVDYQSFGDENLGTCALIGPLDVHREKAMVACDRLNSETLLAIPFTKDVARIGDLSLTPSPVVLTALDSANARRAVQMLWPDLVIDGAIGDYMCQVGFHPGDLSLDVACLRCVYPPDSEALAGFRVDPVASSGLPADRVGAPDDIVRLEDVERAPAHKRAELRLHLGKKICAVVASSVAQAIADREMRAEFEPSVPFVACASGAMVVGELVRHLSGTPTSLEPRFQFDVLRGISKGLEFSIGRNERCECRTRRALIESLRGTHRPGVQGS